MSAGLPHGPALRQALEKCCASQAWLEAMVGGMAARGSELGPESTLPLSERAFDLLGRDDWLEAFSQHPKIGDLPSLSEKFGATAPLAASEQSGTRAASRRTLEELQAANEEYEARFGYIFIVCATGKTAAEMLRLLRTRLQNDNETELARAAKEQRKITRLRLEGLIRG